MQQSTKNQWTILEEQDTNLGIWIGAFLIDRKTQGLSKATIHFYLKKLELLSRFCEGQIISQITQLNPQILREYLLWLERRGITPAVSTPPIGH